MSAKAARRSGRAAARSSSAGPGSRVSSPRRTSSLDQFPQDRNGSLDRHERPGRPRLAAPTDQLDGLQVAAGWPRCLAALQGLSR